MAKLRDVRAELGGKGAAPTTNPTVTELWDRYRAIKAERRSKIMENALVSTFKTCVLPAIGQARANAVTASQLQGRFNALAKAGRSHSAIEKARTHIRALFELAVDDKILDVSLARRITMPKRIRKVDDTPTARRGNNSPGTKASSTSRQHGTESRGCGTRTTGDRGDRRQRRATLGGCRNLLSRCGPRSSDNVGPSEAAELRGDGLR